MLRRPFKRTTAPSSLRFTVMSRPPLVVPLSLDKRILPSHWIIFLARGGLLPLTARGEAFVPTAGQSSVRAANRSEKTKLFAGPTALCETAECIGVSTGRRTLRQPCAFGYSSLPVPRS